MKKILILTLNNSSPKGGSEKLWRVLASALTADGYEVTASVYCHQKEHVASALDSRIKLLKRVPKRHGKTPISRLAYRFIGEFLEHRQLRIQIKRSNPDFIFFSFGGFAEMDNPKILAVMLDHNIPYATVFHNNTENYVFQRKSSPLAKQVWLKSVNNFVVSHRIVEIFKRQIGMKKLDYKIIVNPMAEVSLTSTDIYDNLDDVVKMAFIGTLDIGVKGIALLLQVLSQCNFGNSNWELNLFGEGSDRDVIQDLVFQFGLEKKVFLKGWINDVDEIWNRHQLLLLPSFNEGMPMVIHEAMLRQRVVIATDVGGNGEIITHKLNGFLSPAASFAHLKQTIELGFARRHEWAKIACNARQSILKARASGHSIQDILSVIDHELN